MAYADATMTLLQAVDKTMWRNGNSTPTYYLKKIDDNTYEAWNSTSTSANSVRIGIDQAVSYYNQNILSTPAKKPTPTNPVKTATTTQNAKTKSATPKADDDGNSTTVTTAPTSNTPLPQGVRTTTRDDLTPGRRIKNPLAYLSSYTYQISLYMITPDAYESFVASGRKNIQALKQNGGSGVYLVAQSGGINNTNSDRAPSFDFDYSIDGLEIKSYVSGAESASATNTTDFKFRITEPYGFSFLDNLRRAGDAIHKMSNNKDMIPEQPTKQFFILGVRFFGYDENGDPVDGNTVYDGAALDPNATGASGLFERYYDIYIRSVKFKLDGKATIYNIEANSLAPGNAFSVTRGMTTGPITVTADTVGEAIQQIFDKLNADQQTLHGADNILNEYKFVPLGDDADQILSAKLVTNDVIDKLQWPGSTAKKTTESNDSTAIKAKPTNTATTRTFPAGKSILSIFDDLIKSSEYIKNALEVLHDSSLEPNSNKQINSIKNNGKTTINWYNCSVQLSQAEWKGTAWKYTMTYGFQTYKTPIIDSAYAKPSLQYYGPHKRYDYWYSGKNSEILQYEQQLNNEYFTVTLSSLDLPEASANTSTGSTSSDSTTANPNIPVIAGMKSGQSSLGTLGATAEAPNNYVTSLYDPASLASSTIVIMGDPDFMVQDSTFSENAVYNRFYGTDGFTINSNGGQVFIEIDFKEAVDYSSDDQTGKLTTASEGITGQPGTMSLNDSILFWKYPSSVSKVIKGVCYQVNSVVSSFTNGSFKQTIKSNIKTWPEDTPTEAESSTARSASTTNPTSSVKPIGLKTENSTVPASSNFITDMENSLSSIEKTSVITTNTNNAVPDDDGINSVLTWNPDEYEQGRS